LSLTDDDLLSGCTDRSVLLESFVLPDSKGDRVSLWRETLPVVSRPDFFSESFLFVLLEFRSHEEGALLMSPSERFPEEDSSPVAEVLERLLSLLYLLHSVADDLEFPF
jgi:hypothetical protein